MEFTIKTNHSFMTYGDISIWAADVNKRITEIMQRPEKQALSYEVNTDREYRSFCFSLQPNTWAELDSSLRDVTAMKADARERRKYKHLLMIHFVSSVTFLAPYLNLLFMHFLLLFCTLTVQFQRFPHIVSSTLFNIIMCISPHSIRINGFLSWLDSFRLPCGLNKNPDVLLIDICFRLKFAEIIYWIW